MKLVVDALPEQKDCPFSKWHPYPPIIEEPGYYQCKLTEGRNDGCYMDREKGKCEFLVEMRKVRAQDA